MEVKALITELEQVSSQYGAIVKEFDGKVIPAEKQAELKKLHARALELKAQIDGAKALVDGQKDMDGLREFLARPVATLPQPKAINADDDGRKALIAMGWEIKGQMLFAPTSVGKPQEMWPVDVLFGKMPSANTEDGAKKAEFYRLTRAAMQPAYRQAYTRFVYLCTKSRTESMAFASLDGLEQKALNEGADESGGYVVPPDAQAEILIRLAQKAIVRKYAKVQPTTSDVLKWPMVQAASATEGGLSAGGGSVFSSGFVGDWAGETPVFTDKDPKFGQFNVAIKKIRCGTKLSNDFVADAATDVLVFLSVNGSENMALVEDKGFFTGDGTALQPKGLLNSGAATVDVEGSTANTISNTTAAAGSAPKLIDLVYALPPQYAQNARTIMTRATEGKIRKLVNGQGSFHWPVSGFGATPSTLFDLPKDNTAFMPDDGTDGNKVLLHGDLSAYVIGQRAQISTIVLRERFADTDQVGIILTERVGGDTWNPDALRIGIV